MQNKTTSEFDSLIAKLFGESSDAETTADSSGPSTTSTTPVTVEAEDGETEEQLEIETARKVAIDVNVKLLEANARLAEAERIIAQQQAQIKVLERHLDTYARATMFSAAGASAANHALKRSANTTNSDSEEKRSKRRKTPRG